MAHLRNDSVNKNSPSEDIRPQATTQVRTYEIEGSIAQEDMNSSLPYLASNAKNREAATCASLSVVSQPKVKLPPQRFNTSTSDAAPVATQSLPAGMTTTTKALSIRGCDPKGRSCSLETPIESPLSTGGLPRSGSDAPLPAISPESPSDFVLESMPLSTPQTRPSIARLGDVILENQAVSDALDKLQSELSMTQIELKLGDVVGRSITAYYTGDGVAMLQDLTNATLIAQQHDLQLLAARAQLWKAIILHSAGQTENIAGMLGDVLWLVGLEDINEADCYQLRRILTFYNVRVWRHIRFGDADAVDSGNAKLSPDLSDSKTISESHQWLDQVFEYLESRIDNAVWPSIQESLTIIDSNVIPMGTTITSLGDRLTQNEEQLRLLQAENERLIGDIARYRAEREIFGGKNLKTPASGTMQSVADHQGLITISGEPGSRSASRVVFQNLSQPGNLRDNVTDSGFQSVFSWQCTPTRDHWGTPKLPLSSASSITSSRYRNSSGREFLEYIAGETNTTTQGLGISGISTDQPWTSLRIRNGSQHVSASYSLRTYESRSSRNTHKKSPLNRVWRQSSRKVKIPESLLDSRHATRSKSNSDKNEEQVSPKATSSRKLSLGLPICRTSVLSPFSNRALEKLASEFSGFLDFWPENSSRKYRVKNDQSSPLDIHFKGGTNVRNAKLLDSPAAFTGFGLYGQNGKCYSASNTYSLTQNNFEDIPLAKIPSPTELKNSLPSLREHQDQRYQSLKPYRTLQNAPVSDSYEDFKKRLSGARKSGQEPERAAVGVSDKQQSAARTNPAELQVPPGDSCFPIARRVIHENGRFAQSVCQSPTVEVNERHLTSSTGHPTACVAKSRLIPLTGIPEPIGLHESFGTTLLSDSQPLLLTASTLEQAPRIPQPYAVQKWDLKQTTKGIALSKVISNASSPTGPREMSQMSPWKCEESNATIGAISIANLTPFLEQLQTDQAKFAGHLRRTSLQNIPSPLRSSFEPSDEYTNDSVEKQHQSRGMAKSNQNFILDDLVETLQQEMGAQPATDTDRTSGNVGRSRHAVYRDVSLGSSHHNRSPLFGVDDTSAWHNCTRVHQDAQERSQSIYDKIDEEYPSPLSSTRDHFNVYADSDDNSLTSEAQMEAGYQTDTECIGTELSEMPGKSWSSSKRLLSNTVSYPGVDYRGETLTSLAADSDESDMKHAVRELQIRDESSSTMPSHAQRAGNIAINF